jgi:ABC-type Zn uptake system ZnuABC Zn-binding protein ZnuA
MFNVVDDDHAMMFFMVIMMMLMMVIRMMTMGNKDADGDNDAMTVMTMVKIIKMMNY